MSTSWADMEDEDVTSVVSPSKPGIKTREELILEINELMGIDRLTNAARLIKIGGLSDVYDVKDIIKRLTERKEFKEAAKVAKMFGLGEEFPPAAFTAMAFQAKAYRDFLHC